MNDINFDTDNLVIVCYLNYAGGKFLINSLGLNEKSVFQDSYLAQKQLDGEFSVDQKLNYLRTELKKPGGWNDLNLGCQSLFGIDTNLYLRYNEKIFPYFTFNNIIQKLSNSSLKFFIAAHSITSLKQYIKQWRNAKIIIFENSYNFISQRGDQIQNQWNNIRGNSWPLDAPTSLDELNTYPKFIIDEIATKYQWLMESISINSTWLQELIKQHNIEIQEFKNNHNSQILFFDNNVYFSESDTLNTIHEIYNELDLYPYNAAHISEYYKLWDHKLKKIKYE